MSRILGNRMVNADFARKVSCRCAEELSMKACYELESRIIHNVLESANDGNFNTLVSCPKVILLKHLRQLMEDLEQLGYQVEVKEGNNFCPNIIISWSKGEN